MSNLFQIQQKLRVATILNLRRIFSDPTGVDRYAYIELPSGEYDFDNTRIVISDSIPSENAFFPAITVDTISGVEQRYLGPDSLGETKDKSETISYTGITSTSFTGCTRGVAATTHNIGATIVSIAGNHFTTLTQAVGVSDIVIRVNSTTNFPTSGVITINSVATSDQIFTSIPLTVNINVHTIDDTKARDEILDRIYDHFKLITTDLAEAGIEIKRTTFVPDRRAFNGDRWYITATISMEVYCEWHDDLSVDKAVSGVNLALSLEP